MLQLAHQIIEWKLVQLERSILTDPLDDGHESVGVELVLVERGDAIDVEVVALGEDVKILSEKINIKVRDINTFEKWHTNCASV